MEEAARSLVEYIRGRGLSARLRLDEGEPVVEIDVDGKIAEVRLSRASGGSLELRLRYPGKPGVTVLKCSGELPLRCAEELLRALRE